MDVWLGAIALLLMFVGLAGVVVPVVPGVGVIWVAGVGSLLLAGPGAAGWVVIAILTVLLMAATLVKVVLPARTARLAGAPRRSLAIGAASGAVGFFVVPVLGLLVGGVLGLYLAERVRLGDDAAAWHTTRSVLLSAGVAALIELATGVAMIALWLGVVIASS